MTFIFVFSNFLLNNLVFARRTSGISHEISGTHMNPKQFE